MIQLMLLVMCISGNCFFGDCMCCMVMLLVSVSVGMNSSMQFMMYVENMLKLVVVDVSYISIVLVRCSIVRMCCVVKQWFVIRLIRNGVMMVLMDWLRNVVVIWFVLVCSGFCIRQVFRVMNYVFQMKNCRNIIVFRCDMVCVMVCFFGVVLVQIFSMWCSDLVFVLFLVKLLKVCLVIWMM